MIREVAASVRARWLALSMLLCAAPAGAAIASLDIPAGDLGRALLELGRQADISIVFSQQSTDGLRTEGLRAEATPREALDTLLAGHCLSYRRIGASLYAVKDGCAAAPPAGASHPPGRGPDPPPAGVERLVVVGEYVTGSRIRIPEVAGDAHIDIVDRSEIELAGQQTLGGLLRYVPAVAGNSTSTLISNGGNGTATVTLRGLPATNTLVLLNGRRTNPDALIGQSVDLNTLPVGLVERVEIVKDGASAIYGSDAIAGVVNVITRRDVSGVHVNTYYGRSIEGDLGTFNGDVLWGTGIADHRVVLGASFFDQGALWSRDRSLSSSSDDRSRGGIDKRSSATAPARVTVGETALVLRASDGSDPGDFRPATDEDRFEYRDFTTSIVPSRRWSLFAHAEGPLAGAAGYYFEAMYTDTRATNTLAPVPLFTGFEVRDLTVSAANPYNPFGVPLTDVRRRMVEMPPRVQENDSETTRWVAGAAGSWRELNWDFALTDAWTDARESQHHALNAERTQAALGADCFAPCVALNLFGPAGSVTPDMIGYLATAARSQGRSRLRSAALALDFGLAELPAGMIEVASGFEYRDESLRLRPDAVTRDGNAIGGPNFGPVDGARHIWEAYAELFVPIFADQPYGTSLDVHVAGRVSQYSDFGRSSNPRWRISYRPVPNVALRASFAEGFRAPSLLQLHASPTSTFEQVNDPCAFAPNVGVLPGCGVQSDPTLNQFLTFESGNPDLDPEKAETRNFGLVWTPSERFALRADYFRIDQRDVVDGSAQYVVDLNAEARLFADLVRRDDNGNIAEIRAPALNVGRRDVRGWDLSTDYRLDTRAGRLRLAANATRLDTFSDRFSPRAPVVDHAGTFNDEASSGNGALPTWKVNVGLDWTLRGWHVGYTMYHVSALDEVVPLLDARRRIEAWRVHNLQVRYYGPTTGWTEVRLGVNNLFDAEPPFSAAAFNDSYDARTYDITGRYLYLQLRKDFGV